METNNFNASKELEELFDFIHPSMARDILWEWLKVTVSGSFNSEFDQNDKTLVINLYEKIDKILEAAEKYYNKAKS